MHIEIEENETVVVEIPPNKYPPYRQFVIVRGCGHHEQFLISSTSTDFLQEELKRKVNRHECS